MATVSISFEASSGGVFTSGIPERVTIAGTGSPAFPVEGYAFDAAADEYIYFRFKLRNYGSGNLTCNIDWYSRSGSTSGNIVASAAIGCMTDGDSTSYEAKSLATASTATAGANGTAKGPDTATVTISNLDSITNGDQVILRVGRVGSNGSDTMSGDAIFTVVELQWSDT